MAVSGVVVLEGLIDRSQRKRFFCRACSLRRLRVFFGVGQVVPDPQPFFGPDCELHGSWGVAAGRCRRILLAISFEIERRGEASGSGLVWAVGPPLEKALQALSVNST